MPVLHYSISGNVGVAAAGATVTLSGAASATTTADIAGNYTFGGLLNGAYFITPALAGFVFTPHSAARSISGANVTGVNFTPSPIVIPPASVVFKTEISARITSARTELVGTNLGTRTMR